MTRPRLAAAALAALVVLLVAGGTAAAHDDIASSTPASGTKLDEPISEVTIDFGVEISDAELALIGPDDEVITPTETVLISPTAARIDFAELEREGVYLVRYLAPSNDGHTVAGAIQFTYGSAGGSSSTGVVLAFCAVAILVLSIGAFFSWRRYRTLSSPHVDDIDDLTDIGV